MGTTTRTDTVSWLIYVVFSGSDPKPKALRTQILRFWAQGPHYTGLWGHFEPEADQSRLPMGAKGRSLLAASARCSLEWRGLEKLSGSR